MTTPLIHWYMRHGLDVSNVTTVIEYDPDPCFKNFGERVTEARRGGDINPSKMTLAETFKQLGNSAYGKTLTNIGKFREVKFTTADRACPLINQKGFRSLTELTGYMVEVSMNKRKIDWNLPLQIGYFVYQYAKLRTLEFHYDCIDKYIDRADYQPLEMDTDSLYLALPSSNLEDIVKPQDREAFYSERDEWSPAEACHVHKDELRGTRLARQGWDASHCEECFNQKRQDKRTPALFKTEYCGDGFFGLWSKTCYCFNGRYIHEKRLFF